MGQFDGPVAAAGAEIEEEAEVTDQHEAGEEGDGGEDVTLAGGLHGFELGVLGCR